MATSHDADITHSTNNPRPCDDLGLLYSPPALDDDSLHKLKRVVRAVHRLHRREVLYHVGTPFQAIYVVTSGAIKSYRIAPVGEEQIAAFHLPGEFLGLSAIGRGCHPHSAQALELTHVRALPYQRLSELARVVPNLQRQLLRLMSGVIARGERLHEVLAGHSAEQRLAFMLIDLRQRLPTGRSSPDVLRLPMSRAELGASVGLAAETTTRVLGRFERAGWISTSGRDLVFSNAKPLDRLVGAMVQGTAT